MYQNQICLKVGQSLTALFRNQMKDCKLQKLNLQKIITHLLQVIKELNRKKLEMNLFFMAKIKLFANILIERLFIAWPKSICPIPLWKLPEAFHVNVHVIKIKFLNMKLTITLW